MNSEYYNHLYPVLMFKKPPKWLKPICSTLIGLLFFSAFISVWIPLLEALRLVFGGFYVLIAPGLAITYVFLKEGEIEFYERIPFGFGLSLVMVPFLVFGLFRLGMTINAWTILAVVTGLVALSGGMVLLKNHK